MPLLDTLIIIGYTLKEKDTCINHSQIKQLCLLLVKIEDEGLCEKS